MAKTKEEYKKELLQEIKTLSHELAECNSFVGLLSHEMTFNKIHEKFIVLKFLERNRLGLEVLDEPIPLEEDDFEEETEQEPEEVKVTIEEEEKKDIKFPAESYFDETVYDDNRDEEKETGETMPKEVDVNYPEEKEYTTEWKIDKSYPPIQLDLNDRIAFQNILFDGDKEQLNLVEETLNRINSLSSSLEYLQDLSREMGWNSSDKKEYVERLTELVEKRFE